MKPTTEQKLAFAQRMAQLLFEMRIEQDMPYGNECEPVPQEWGDKIVDDPEHMVLIKNRIRDSILESLEVDPMRFFNTEKGDYEYHTDTFDHAFCVDGYLDELYEKQRKARIKTRYVVRLEVEKIEYDPETGEEDFLETDSGETAGNFKNYEDALKAQSSASNLIKEIF